MRQCGHTPAPALAVRGRWRKGEGDGVGAHAHPCLATREMAGRGPERVGVGAQVATEGDSAGGTGTG